MIFYRQVGICCISVLVTVYAVCLVYSCNLRQSSAGQEVEVDLEKDILTVLEDGKQYALKSIGEVWIQANDFIK